ncbi:hypothetical protein MXM33_04890 [Acinetobacter vivianii]|uniref:hypothetical protein n=1 Tax=Acinetobacter vivianii TaxID=1776742 RepID=UPI002DBECC74|nr:hypothetical protein [Acinetobacter vivianii]MEB6666363.1 hypothetical protein [Acinetobacter vivianii]
MNLSQLIALDQQDSDDLSRSQEFVKQYKTNVDIFYNNAKNLKDYIDYKIEDLLGPILTKIGITRFNYSDSMTWSLKNKSISISLRNFENATLSKLSCITQIVIKRGSLESVFNIKVMHRESNFFEFANLFKQQRDRLPQNIPINKLNIVKRQLLKMETKPNLTSSSFKGNSPLVDDMILNYKGIEYIADEENLLVILEDILNSSECLKA